MIVIGSKLLVKFDSLLNTRGFDSAIAVAMIFASMIVVTWELWVVVLPAGSGLHR